MQMLKLRITKMKDNFVVVKYLLESASHWLNIPAWQPDLSLETYSSSERFRPSVTQAN